jgi:hypothetical protein
MDLTQALSGLAAKKPKKGVKLPGGKVLKVDTPLPTKKGYGNS